jgi:hypothetical protein
MQNNVVQAAWKAAYADGPVKSDYNVFWVWLLSAPLSACGAGGGGGLLG